MFVIINYWGGIYGRVIRKRTFGNKKSVPTFPLIPAKKFKMLAEHAEDDKVKNCFKEISDKHQGHFNMLYNQL